MDLITPGFGLIFWQTVIFLALVFVLSKYAWKPMLNAVKERESSIEESLAAAEKAKEEMSKLQSDNEKLLDEARLERDKIIKEALATANNIKDEAKTAASKISGKMIEDAKLAINNEKQAALTEMKNQVASLSLEIAERLLRQNLDDQPKQSQLVDQYLNDLNIN
ncbi:MAG: F0F1 ATP synthase subunit B [Cyclobacteriaceae bacterium]|nr:F0F1 ATP synthase subunit B [Cyclobacteriaceae bacterium]